MAFLERFKNMFGKNDKRVRIVFILGIAGIVLIGVSQIWPFGSPGEEPVIPSGNAVLETEQYKTSLEERIAALISSVEGAGNAEVMITLESGVEYVYEKEQNFSSALNEDNTQGNGSKYTRSEDNKESFVLVEDANGRKTALVRKLLEPRVQGVVVVCEGGGRATVAQNIYSLVSTALGIGYDRVCVIKSN